MSVNYQGSEQPWISGTPWRDMRLHAAIKSGPGERSVPVSGYMILNRNPEWILTSDDHAGFLVPSTRSELQRLPAGSGRIVFKPYFRYGQPWIKIFCSDRQLENVFLSFCEMTLVELSEGTGTADSLQLVLERFRQLFEEADEAVSSEQIVGLFAELTILHWLLDNGIDALPAWLGPTKETHDFVFGRTHLEVKALRASGARLFRVSNIHQLEQPADGKLFLIGVRLAPGNETVGTLCDQIRKKIEPKRLVHFTDSLRKAGCALPVSSSWNRQAFSCVDQEAWLVDQLFPKLVSSMLPDGVLPAGVSSVKYSVSLEHASSNIFLMSDVLQNISNETRES